MLLVSFYHQVFCECVHTSVIRRPLSNMFTVWAYTGHLLSTLTKQVALMQCISAYIISTQKLLVSHSVWPVMLLFLQKPMAVIILCGTEGCMLETNWIMLPLNSKWCEKLRVHALSILLYSILLVVSTVWFKPQTLVLLQVLRSKCIMHL